MATVISESDFHLDLLAVRTAISEESWASAYKYLAMAECVHAGLLFQKSGEGGAEGRRDSLQAIRNALDKARLESLREGDPKRLLEVTTRHVQ